MSKTLAWSVAILAWLLAGNAAHAGVRHYFYTDMQGTVLAKADAAGNTIEASDYRPYGTQALGMAANAPGYTGHVNDADSGLVYMQARYYDPTVGAFVSVDPDRGWDGNISSFNRFTYANNNPLRYVDLDGRAPSFMEQQFPKGSLFRTAGESIAADTAFIVGVATNNRPLADAAIEGMRDATSGGKGAEAAIILLTTGKGGNEEVGNIGRLEDSALVCRGGSCTADRFASGSGVSINSDGTMNGVSVNSANGASLPELTSNIPHRSVGVTTVGAVRQAGGDVVSSPTRGNPSHATLQGITPETAQQLMTPTIKNPNQTGP